MTALTSLLAAGHDWEPRFSPLGLGLFVCARCGVSYTGNPAQWLAPCRAKHTMSLAEKDLRIRRLVGDRP